MIETTCAIVFAVAATFFEPTTDEFKWYNTRAEQDPRITLQWLEQPRPEGAFVELHDACVETEVDSAVQALTAAKRS